MLGNARVHTALWMLGALSIIATTGWWATTSLRASPEKAKAFSSEATAYPTEMMRFLASWEGPSVEWKEADDLPADLSWEDGQSLPRIGDPRAVKGGVLRLRNVGPFPSSLRTFGANSRQFFRYSMYDTVQLKLTELHPTALRPMPATADRWAVSSDGRTVFFHIDPEARYSNGRPVRAGDFAFAWYVRCHPNAQDPTAIAALRRKAEKLTIYGDVALALTLPTARPLAPHTAACLLPAEEPSFYAEYGSDYIERYQWRAAPTTGAYEVKPDLMRKGRTITLSRVKNWWARDKKFYRFTANVDAIEHHFIPDEAQAWELFLKNELDLIVVRKTSAWQDKLERNEVYDGLIEKHTFYARYPMPPYGVYLNTQTSPTNDLNVRLGIQHALDMRGSINALSRSTDERKLNYSEGYGMWSLDGLEERRYDPSTAREYFRRAGYTECDEDGILRKADGTRLSISLTYAEGSPQTASMMAWLRQYARPCGLEIVSDCADAASVATKVSRKQYQAAYWVTALPYPLPDHDAAFHSRFAHTESDNITDTADAEMDAALEAESKASSTDELKTATLRVQQLIYDGAAYVPARKENCVRIANWRYVRFPDTPETPFSTPTPYDVEEAHLYWIDPSWQRSVRRARRTGETFPEVDVIHDTYR